MAIKLRKPPVVIRHRRDGNTIIIAVNGGVHGRV
jgi:hypothetical protein